MTENPIVPAKAKYFRDLAGSVPYLHISVQNNKLIAGLSYDSREIRKDYLFFAIRGERSDGNSFIEDALNSGAAGIITDKEDVYNRFQKNTDALLVNDCEKTMAIISNFFFDNVLDNIALIGVTGTNGKTSTAIFTNAIIKTWNKTCGLLGTIYNDTGEGLQKSVLTTPLSLDSLRIFRRMHLNGLHRVVMEVSSHSIDRKRIYGFPFFIGALTNISQDHLDYHKDMESYKRVKFSFFNNVVKDGYCIIPYNMLNESGLKNILLTKNIITFNDRNADYYIKQKKYSDQMVLLWLKTKDDELSFSTRYFNDFMHENILLAVAIAKTIGIPNLYIAKALEDAPVVPGRVELVHEGKFTVYIDYAHTPDAILRVIKEFKDLYPERRIITIFGAGGNKDKGKRPIMGRNASEYSDILFITSDNPRYENPSSIISEIYEGIDKDIRAKKTIYLEEDRDRAIRNAILTARETDIILILGKGHEEVLEVNGKLYPFSDRDIVLKYTGKAEKK